MSVIKPEFISDRIIRRDMLPLSFLKLSPYTGSKRGIRFRLERYEPEPGNGNMATVLRCSAWRGAFAYAHTPASEMAVRDFDFTDEGIDKAVGFLNALADGTESFPGSMEK